MYELALTRSLHFYVFRSWFGITEIAGKTLNDLITEAGLRKKELADLSGVDVATIIRIGNGKATTRVTVVKLVRVLEKYLDRSIDIDSIQGLNINK